MKKLHYIYIPLFILLTFFFPSCLGDKEQDVTDSEKETYSITYRISTKSSNDQFASDDEMMKTILLFIVDSNNKIERKVAQTLPTTKQVHEIEVKLTAGVKTVYGFANLSAENIANAGLNLEEGATMPDLSSTTATVDNGYTISSATSNYLPMSNKTIFTVAKIAGQTFNMELIRMMCKMKLNFKNETGNTISLKNIVLTPVTTSSIYLLPRSNGEVPPELPGSTTVGDYTYTFSGTPSFISGGALNDFQFYFNESQVSQNGYFKLTLNTLRNGVTDEARMSLTNLSYINRNSYLPLDIILIDYRLDPEVLSYPPIGGYPASVTKETDGYHCKFPGGGPFIITPKLMKISDNSAVSVANSDWNFSYTDAAPTIFDKAPELKNGEIKGTIKSSANSKIMCIVSVNVITSANVTRTISYKMYISQN
jgi:hypothetical protein